jgi:hypothetical protein
MVNSLMRTQVDFARRMFPVDYTEVNKVLPTDVRLGKTRAAPLKRNLKSRPCFVRANRGE